MVDQLDAYDLLSLAVPGTLLAYWIGICFPVTVEIVGSVSAPDAIAVIAFGALVILLGGSIQALASVAQAWILFPSWGGKPSSQLLQGYGKAYDRVDIKQTVDRVKNKLITKLGATQNNESLFRYAMSLAEPAESSRAPRFNSLYALHRSLFVSAAAALIVLLSSVVWGVADEWSSLRNGLLAAMLRGLLIVEWYRTKQRAFDYALEVLVTAERVLDPPAASSNGRASS